MTENLVIQSSNYQKYQGVFMELAIENKDYGLFDGASGNNQAIDKSVQFLTFAVDGEEYGVEIINVREVKSWHEATRLPNSPNHVLGVINLRGVVIPIYDLRIRFGLGKTQVSDLHVVIIMAVGDRILGVLVDGVSDIITINESQIKDAPNHDKINVDEKFVKGLIGINGKMVILLNMQELLITH
jgi:purine-binding chemotaxis protein CheW